MRLKKLMMICLVAGSCTMSMTGTPKPLTVQAQKVTGTCKELKVLLNQKEVSVSGFEVKGKLFLPLKETAEKMGADVYWDAQEKAVIVNNPLYYKEQLYLSYLAGLMDHNKDAELAPLPARVSDLELPQTYPLKSEEALMLHEKPISITIKDGKYEMPFAAYDYENIDGKIYISEDWLNTIFLAQIAKQGNEVVIDYPEEQQISQEIKKIEEVLKPRSPQEALNLWVRGQQMRSGALQYCALSQKRQEEVWIRRPSWVTGGSSPSAGKAVILDQKQETENTCAYTIEIEVILQGKVEEKIKQFLKVIGSQEEAQKIYVIDDAAGSLDYFTLLGSEIE